MIHETSQSETMDETSSPSIEMEVLIGALTAVTLLLLFLFVSIVFIYSRRQKFLNSPTSRSLNPFPVQINMKVKTFVYITLRRHSRTFALLSSISAFMILKYQVKF